MSVQIKGEQIQNSTIEAGKLVLSGQTYDFSSSTLRASSTPSHDNDVATRSFVLDRLQGLSYKDPVEVATDSAPAATYNNAAGTLTYDATGALTIDSIAISLNDRILVKSFAGAASIANGIYKMTTAGDGSTAAILTRTDDMNEADEFPSAAVFVKQGSSADALFVCQQDSVTIGTTQISFAQASGAGSLNAGSGLSKAGNTLSVDIAADKGLEFNGSQELQIKAHNGISLTSDGVSVLLDGATLATSVSGIKINNLGVGTAQLAAQAVSSAKLGAIAGNGLTGGSGSSLAVQVNGAGPLSVDGSGVDIALDGSSLAKSGSGIKVADDGIGPDQLASNAVGAAALGAIAGNGLTGGSGSAIAVQANGAGPISVSGAGVDIALDGSTLSKSGSGIKVNTGGIGSNEIASDAVKAAEFGLRPQFEDFTGNGSDTTFDLQFAIPSTLVQGVKVFRNGLRIKLVQSNPQTDEYTVSATGGSGGVGRITIGGTALTSSDKLFIDYIYEPS